MGHLKVIALSAFMILCFVLSFGQTSGQADIDCEQFFSNAHRDLDNDELYSFLNIQSSDELSSVAAVRLVNGKINDDGCLFFEMEFVSTNYTTYGLRFHSANGQVSEFTRTWIDWTNESLRTLTALETRSYNFLLYPDSHVGVQLNKWGFDGTSDTYRLRFTDLVQALRIAFDQGLLIEEPDLDVAAASETILSVLADESDSPELAALALTINALRAGGEGDPEILAQAVFDWGKLILQSPSVREALGDILIGNLTRLLDLADFYSEYLQIQPIWDAAVNNIDAATLDIDYLGIHSIGEEDCGQIAFVTDRDGNDEIYVMNPDGSDMHNLTNHPARDIEPAWAPDGRRIVFASDRGGNFDLFVLDVDTGQLQNITSTVLDERQPAWSSDGSNIAFNGLSILDLTTGAIRPLPVRGAYPTWSPDGTRLAFSAYDNRRNRNFEVPIWVYDVELNELVLYLPYVISWGGEQSLDWSPNGEYLAVSSYLTDAFTGITIIDVVNQEIESVFLGDPDDESIPQFPSGPSWSPDGHQLVAVAGTRNNVGLLQNDIFRMRPDGTDSVQITFSAETEYSATWSPCRTENTVVAYLPNPDVPSLAILRPSTREEALEFDSLWSLTSFNDMQSPGSADYEVGIEPRPYRWSFLWCADNAERLNEILAPMSFSVNVNSTLLSEAALLQTDINNCRMWDMVIEGWTSGTTIPIELRYTLNESIFDGVATYEAGEYIHRMNVKVR